MSSLIAPASISELVEAVRAHARLLPVGAGTKSRLVNCDTNVTRLSLTGLSGILQYDPSEFTFTAFAGTPLREISAALAERGQYLPFDPPLADSGATLGGTLAAGLSGPGRLRFGGVRDFVLAVRFVDGAGRLLLLGSKVVKNSAGFDLPKFFVGSLGRFGVVAELTFKVFPRPPSRLTLQLPVEGMTDAARIVVEAANGRWEAEALDVLPGAKAVLLRLSGAAAALSEMATDILKRWPGEVLSPETAEQTWTSISEFAWARDRGSLLKIAVTPDLLTALADAVGRFADARLHLSAAGNLAFLSLPSGADSSTLGEDLGKLGLCALTLRGDGPLWLGTRTRPAVMDAVKKALDPNNRFPSLDN
jgi:glycolate oxidase FAD binding subunit